MGPYCTSKFALEGFSEVLAQEVVPYGIRVVVVEPGVIRTPIFAKAPPAPEETAYPMHYERTLAYFMKTIPSATQPSVVADAIAGAIDDPTSPFRIAVGSSAEQLLAGRAAISDEELIAMGAGTTDEWFAAFQEHFGLDLRG
jgi:NAD(P)-dependent dehydrogenase (short-subunit alcohol dehydrogenase family)